MSLFEYEIHARNSLCVVKTLIQSNHGHSCRPPGKQYTNHRLLLGTHTSRQAHDYVQITSLELPKRDDMPGEKLGKDNYDEESGGTRTDSRVLHLILP